MARAIIGLTLGKIISKKMFSIYLGKNDLVLRLTSF